MTDGDAGQTTKFSREELYQRVWANPLNKLAAEFGTTGTVLANICKKFSVPYPAPGYWTKLAAGKQVQHTPLPGWADGPAPTITITRAPPKSKAAPKVEPMAPAAKPPAKKSQAPAHVSRLHPIIDLWIYEREKRRKDARRGISYDPGEFTDTEKRRHRILDALFKGVEDAGGKTREGDRNELFAEMNGERIEFNIRQKQRRVSRPLTRDERLDSWNKGKETTFEMKTTDILVLKPKIYLPGSAPHEWAETVERPLEEMVPDIVAAFVEAGPLLVQRRLQREEEERQRRIAEAERQEERDRRKRDDNRWHLFGRIAAQARQADEARLLMDIIKGKTSDLSAKVGERTVGEWIEWLGQRIDDADPKRREPEDIFGTLAALSAWNYQIQD